MTRRALYDLVFELLDIGGPVPSWVRGALRARRYGTVFTYIEARQRVMA